MLPRLLGKERFGGVGGPQGVGGSGGAAGGGMPGSPGKLASQEQPDRSSRNAKSRNQFLLKLGPVGIVGRAQFVSYPRDRAARDDSQFGVSLIGLIPA